LEFGHEPELDPVKVVPIAKGVEPDRGRFALGILKAGADVKRGSGPDKEIDPQPLAGVVPYRFG
jgi:hypothetical protein